MFHWIITSCQLLHTCSTMAAWLEVISSKVSIFVFCLLDVNIHAWRCYSSFSSSLNVVFSCHLYLNNGFNYFHLRNFHFQLMFLFKIYLYRILCFNGYPFKDPLLQFSPPILHARHYIYNPKTLFIMKKEKAKLCDRQLKCHKKLT